MAVVYKADAVRISGMRELRAEMRAIGNGMPRALGRAQKRVATEFAALAQQKARSEGGALAKGARSIRGGGTQKGAHIRFGGPRYPYMAGAEFGSTKYRQF